MQVFSELVRSIQRTQAELVVSIEEKQRQTERWAEGFIAELEQEIAELKQRKADLENVARTDHIHFLKVRTAGKEFNLKSKFCSLDFFLGVKIRELKDDSKSFLVFCLFVELPGT